MRKNIYIQILELDDASKLVLEPYHQNKQGNYRNLKKINRCKVVWDAELPKQSFQDAYVGFELISDKLYANTFNCYRCEICLKSGKVLSVEHTK